MFFAPLLCFERKRDTNRRQHPDRFHTFECVVLCWQKRTQRINSLSLIDVIAGRWMNHSNAKRQRDRAVAIDMKSLIAEWTSACAYWWSSYARFSSLIKSQMFITIFFHMIIAIHEEKTRGYCLLSLALSLSKSNTWKSSSRHDEEKSCLVRRHPYGDGSHLYCSTVHRQTHLS